ncbi:hypothetical protein B7494_g1093 [Chlorociboria aeruginascens]|nr:hypothetical protein B7494_g1093 [Chlorociboria aeruginascens]
MRPSIVLATIILLPTTLAATTFARSSKRGLIFIASLEHPSDNQIWVENNSDLTWYYNYGALPSSDYSNHSQATLEFVPMLWGGPPNASDTTFVDSVTTLIKGGTNISHILTFNEPDGSTATGGSDVDPSLAASTWIREVEPLRKLGVKAGAPAVTGAPAGFTWLESFFTACADQGTNCTVDFIPVHWYGNFEGLASHIGQVVATYISPLLTLLLLIYSSYPNTSIWVTEYALPNAALNDTQSFFNTSAEYFDRIDYIDRYSYFGSFRSSASNVGANVAMLDQKGRLTDVGSWYLGGAETNNIPGTNAGAGSVSKEGMMWSLVVALVVGVWAL